MRSTHLTRLVRVEAQEREQTEPRRTITLRVVYAAGLDPIAEPEYEGESYLYELPPRPGDRPW